MRGGTPVSDNSEQRKVSSCISLVHMLRRRCPAHPCVTGAARDEGGTDNEDPLGAVRSELLS